MRSTPQISEFSVSVNWQQSLSYHCLVLGPHYLLLPFVAEIIDQLDTTYSQPPPLPKSVTWRSLLSSFCCNWRWPSRHSPDLLTGSSLQVWWSPRGLLHWWLKGRLASLPVPASISLDVGFFLSSEGYLLTRTKSWQKEKTARMWMS